jgi:hypothetical protein
MSTIEYAIAVIIRQFLPALMAKYALPARTVQTLRTIERCRTSFFGGRTITCTACGLVKTVWNSCGNRNCPTCQSIKKEMWVDKRMVQLLGVKHFHIIFTVPHELNGLMLQNQQLLYGGMFRCA